MTEPTTAAGRALWLIVGPMGPPPEALGHGSWMRTAIAIEAEAVAAERARLRAAVEALNLSTPSAGDPYRPESGWNAALDEVLALLTPEDPR